MELFKYCRPEHWGTMRRSGAVRVGSLFDYKRTDKYGELISDEFDGSKRLAGTISNLDASNISSYPGLDGLIHLEGGGQIGKIDVQNYVRSVPDLLIFSASSAYLADEHLRWQDSESYDVCYRILSARLFFRAISEALGATYSFLGFAPVYYADEIDISAPEAGAHPALVKRQTGYSGQSEVRAIWQPPDPGNVKPITLNQTRARLYVTEHVRLPAREA